MSATVLGSPAFAEGQDLGGADREGAAGPYDGGGRAEPLADRRAQEVDLELHGEDVAVLRLERHHGVAAGRVGGRGDRAGVHEAVLLAQVGAEGQLEGDPAGGELTDLDAQRGEQGLAVRCSPGSVCPARVPAPCSTITVLPGYTPEARRPAYDVGTSSHPALRPGSCRRSCIPQGPARVGGVAGDEPVRGPAGGAVEVVGGAAGLGVQEQERHAGTYGGVLRGGEQGAASPRARAELRTISLRTSARCRPLSLRSGEAVCRRSRRRRGRPTR